MIPLAPPASRPIRFPAAPRPCSRCLAASSGCWYSVDLIDKFQDNGTLQETGHELFVGCIDSGGDGSCSGDPTGTLSFSYVFTGKFDPVTFEEIKGRCTHHVDEGTGGFAQASGVINFKDDVEAGIATYNGNLKLASASNTTATNRSRTPASGRTERRPLDRSE